MPAMSNVRSLQIRRSSKTEDHIYTTLDGFFAYVGGHSYGPYPSYERALNCLRARTTAPQPSKIQ